MSIYAAKKRCLAMLGISKSVKENNRFKTKRWTFFGCELTISNRKPLRELFIVDERFEVAELIDKYLSTSSNADNVLKLKLWQRIGEILPETLESETFWGARVNRNSISIYELK